MATTPKLETEYRLRWSRQGMGRNHRTRYYTRLHFALKAKAKYESKGYTVQLHKRMVEVVGDWRPSPRDS